MKTHIHTNSAVLLLWESVKRHNKRRHMQKGLVTHQPGKTQRSALALKHSTTECDQQGLLGMTELLTGRKGIRQSGPGTMAQHTRMQPRGAKMIECNVFASCL